MCPSNQGKVKQIELLPGVIESLATLQSDFRLILITNQSGVARGYFSEVEVNILNDELTSMLSLKGVHLDGMYYCPHHPKEGNSEYTTNCECRKPNIGLIKIAERDFELLR